MAAVSGAQVRRAEGGVSDGPCEHLAADVVVSNVDAPFTDKYLLEPSLRSSQTHDQGLFSSSVVRPAFPRLDADRFSTEHLHPWHPCYPYSGLQLVPLPRCLPGVFLLGLEPHHLEPAPPLRVPR